MTFELDPFYWQVCRWLTAGVFALALAHKLRSPSAFVAVVRDYELGPARAAPALAGLVLALEGAVVAGLASGLAVAAAAALAACLLGAYAGGIALNLARGRRDIDCGCFGPDAGAGRPSLSGWLLLRNVVLAVPAALLLLPAASRGLAWLDIVGVALASATALVTYAAADQLMTNAARLARSAR